MPFEHIIKGPFQCIAAIPTMPKFQSKIHKVIMSITMLNCLKNSVININVNKNSNINDEKASQPTTVITTTTPMKIDALAIDIHSLVPLESCESSLKGVYILKNLKIDLLAKYFMKKITQLSSIAFLVRLDGT
ncbi:hypothetical protein BpHYR1_016722 [Brachionus plicatilis]|uniref:Uncharacterized protein n=1 Tax=Brachionus plicatilis TaxID=10195 RepID=A0A3M7QKG6_BRAPC|nr:hypothetical protein BpHYR1_016722 [Brachionus plicatilis]